MFGSMKEHLQGQLREIRDGGLYKIADPANWLKTTAPYISKMVKVLKYVSPLVAPALGVAMPDIGKVIGDDIKLMTELVKKLPDMEKDRVLELAEAAGEAKSLRPE